MPARASLILLCAGRGSRMKEHTQDKILYSIRQKPVFIHSLEAFAKTNFFEKIILTFREEEQKSLLKEAIEQFHISLPITFIKGGHERMDSVYVALQEAVSSEFVFIHDAARPVLKVDFLLRMISHLEEHDSSVAASPCVDTMKLLPRDANPASPLSLENIDRDRLWHMQTPQAFRSKDILQAYHEVIDQNITITDDASALSSTGKKVFLTENPTPNPKLTTPGDSHFIEHLLRHIDER